MRESQFYYSGSLEQVNYLTPLDSTVLTFFGNWQMMAFEGAIFLLYGAIYLIFFACSLFYEPALSFLAFEHGVSGLMQAFVSESPLDNLFRLGFTGVLAVVALAFYIVYRALPEFDKGLTKFEAGLYLFLAVFFFLFNRFSLYAAITISFLVALRFTVTAEKGFKRTALFVVEICLLLAVFLPGVPFATVAQRAQCLFAAELVVLGGFILYFALKSRKSITNFLDEQRGFTDYTIE